MPINALTSQVILDKSYRVFCSVAPDTLSMSQLAQLCQVSEETMTERFSNVLDLYQSAFHHALRQQPLMRVKPEHTSSEQWLGELIDGYLSDDHVRGAKASCPLAFLASHNNSLEAIVRETYASAFLASGRWLSQYMNKSHGAVSAQANSLLTSMIGTVSIARSIDNDDSRRQFLTMARSDLYRRLQLPPVLQPQR